MDIRSENGNPRHRLGFVQAVDCNCNCLDGDSNPLLLTWKRKSSSTFIMGVEMLSLLDLMLSQGGVPARAARQWLVWSDHICDNGGGRGVGGS